MPWTTPSAPAPSGSRLGNQDSRGLLRAKKCADDVWIPDVTARGWIILTKDKHIRHRRGHLKALMEAKAVAFILHDNLPAACKSVVDEIASWLGCQNNDPSVRWLYAQKCTRETEMVQTKKGLASQSVNRLQVQIRDRK